MQMKIIQCNKNYRMQMKKLSNANEKLSHANEKLSNANEKIEYCNVSHAIDFHEFRPCSRDNSTESHISYTVKFEWKDN